MFLIFIFQAHEKEMCLINSYLNARQCNILLVCLNLVNSAVSSRIIIHVYTVYETRASECTLLNMPFEERVKHGPYSNHKNEGTFN